MLLPALLLLDYAAGDVTVTTEIAHYHDLDGPSTEFLVAEGPSNEYHEAVGPTQEFILHDRHD